MSETKMNKLALAAMVDRYWAILPEFGSVAAGVLVDLPAPEPTAGRDDGYAHDSRWSDVSARLDDGVVLIQMDGPMTKKFYSSTTAGCSTIEIRRALRDAERDPSVSRIVLAIDSPGGSVNGTADLADEVARVAAVKPVTAYIEGLCASAALWVAAMATEIVASPNALDIGSIGVFTALVDSSECFEDHGYKVTLVSSGGVKGHPMMGVAIPDDVHADVQATIDHIRDVFVAAVATGRKMEQSEVAELATGHTWPAAKALELGLVDRVGTLDAVLQGFSSQAGPSAALSEGCEEDNTMSMFTRFFRQRPEATADPAESQLVAVATSLAESFVVARCHELADNLTPEREGAFKNALALAIAADGGGQPVLDNGRIYTGEMVEAVVAMAKCWSPPVVDKAKIATMPGVQIVGDTAKDDELARRREAASGVANTGVKAEDVK